MQLRHQIQSSLPALLVATLCLWLLVGCGEAEPTPVPAAETTEGPVDVSTAVASPDEASLMTVTPDLPSTVSLTWWTAPHFSPLEGDAASQLLAARLAVFTETQPALTVLPVVKAPYGKGGLLDFLLTTQKAAPTLLPDLVTLDSDELGVAMRAGLLQPLDGMLSEQTLNDLYSFAESVGRLNGQLYAVQFEADIEHLVVNSDLAEVVPRTWDDVLSGNGTYAFPAGREGNPSNAFLVHYASAGGALGARNEPFVIDEIALFGVLEFYEQGRASGVIPSLVLNLESTEDIWPLFAGDRVAMAHVRASRYMAERAQLGNAVFGSLPTAEDDRLAISQGWTLAVVATDAERRAAAVMLLEALLDPALNSAWAQASNRLPTRRSALDLWNQEDPYVQFLRWQLEAARLRPSGSSYLAAASTLQQVQSAVLAGTLTAREATEQAAGVRLP